MPTDYSRMSDEELIGNTVGSSLDYSSMSDEELIRGEAPKREQNTGALGDFGLDIKRGVQQLPGTLAGLADIPSALAFNVRPVSAALDWAGEQTGFTPGKWAEENKALYSPGRQEAMANVNRAWGEGGFTNIAGALINNPSYVGGMIAESIPAMIAGGGIGRAVHVAGKFAPSVAGAIGEGAIGAGSFMENMNQAGVEPRTAALYALPVGATTTAFGYGGAKIANRMGMQDIESWMAGAAAPNGLPTNATIRSALQSGLVRKALGRGVAGAGVEGIFEELPQGVFEQVFGNLAQEKPWYEGVDRAAVDSMLAGMGMGGPFNAAYSAYGDYSMRSDLGNKLTEQGYLPAFSMRPTDLLAGMDRQQDAQEATLADSSRTQMLQERMQALNPAMLNMPDVPGGYALNPFTAEGAPQVETVFPGVTEGDWFDEMEQARIAEEYGVSAIPEQPGRPVRVSALTPVDLTQVETGGATHAAGQTADMFGGPAREVQGSTPYAGPQAMQDRALPDTSNLNDFISMGLQLQSALAYAKSIGDTDAVARLEQLGQQYIYDRMAQGFGTQPAQQGIPLKRRRADGRRWTTATQQTLPVTVEQPAAAPATPATTPQQQNIPSVPTGQPASTTPVTASKRIIHAVPTGQPTPISTSYTRNSRGPQTAQTQQSQPQKAPPSTTKPAAGSLKTGGFETPEGYEQELASRLENEIEPDLEATTVTAQGTVKKPSKAAFDKVQTSALGILMRHTADDPKAKAHIENAATILPKVASLFDKIHRLTAARDKLNTLFANQRAYYVDKMGAWRRQTYKGKKVSIYDLAKSDVENLNEDFYSQRVDELNDVNKELVAAFAELEQDVGINNLQRAQRMDKARSPLQNRAAMLFSSAFRDYSTGQISEQVYMPTAAPKSVRERQELKGFQHSKLASIANKFDFHRNHWTGVRALLMKIRHHGQHPFYANIASRLYHIINEASDFIEPDIRFYARDPDMQGTPDADKEFLYVVDEKGTIKFNHDVTAPTNKNGEVVPGKTEIFADGRQPIIHITERGQNAEVVLHEALHLTLSRYIANHFDEPSVKALDELRKKVMSYSKTAKGLTGEQQTVLQHIAGATGLQEFVSYGLTNGDFQALLQSIKLPNTGRINYFKTAWNAFSSYVRTMLGMPAAANTAFSDFLLGAGDLLLEGSFEAKAAAPTGKTLNLYADLSNTAPANATDNPQIDMRIHAQKPAMLQRFIESFGYDPKRMMQRAKVTGGRFKQMVRDFSPSLAGFMSLLDASFNLPAEIAKTIDDSKAMRKVPVELANTFIRAIEPMDTVDEVMAAFNYLDTGNGEVPAHIQRTADELRAKYHELVKSLPASSNPAAKEAQAYLQGLKLSEALVYVVEAKDAASSSFGAHRLESVKGSIVDKNAIADPARFFAPTDYDITSLSGTFRRYVVPSLAGTEYGYVHESMLDSSEVQGLTAAQRAELQQSEAFKVTNVSTNKTDAPRLTMRGTPTLRSKLGTSGTVDEKGLRETKAALLNTMALLSNAVAASNMSGLLATQGAGKDVFDDKEALWAAYNKQTGTVSKRYSNEMKDLRVMDWAEASERSQKLMTAYRSPDTWIKVPTSPAYGALSGKIVRGSEWMAVQDAYNRGNLIDSEAYMYMLRGFKKVKTVYNLPTHATNILTNVTLAYLHNLSLHTIRDAALLMRKRMRSPQSLTPAELDILTAFDNSSAVLADFSTNELKGVLYDAIVSNLHSGVETGIGRITSRLAIVQNEKVRKVTEWAKRKGWAPAQIDETLTSLYATEDNLFRLAAFMTKVGDLQKAADADAGENLTYEQIIKEAGYFARKAFLDYDIDSRAVNLARQTFLPFLSWTYAVIPVLTRIAIEQPWKLVSLGAAYGAISTLLSAAAGGDDDDETRAMLGMDEKMFGFFGPYTNVRLPIDANGEKTFIPLGKYIPFSSILGFKEQPNGAFGNKYWPSNLVPNGPLMAFAAAVMNVDPYTGKKLSADADTNLERMLKSTQHIWQQMTPGGALGALIPGTKPDFTPPKGLSGSDPNYLANALKLLGIPVTTKNIGDSALGQQAELASIDRKYGEARSKAQKDLMREKLDETAYERRMNSLARRQQEDYDKTLGIRR